MQIKDTETITISLEAYEELLRDQYFLNCLRNAGVDNWDWYSEAVDEFQQEYPDDED